MIVAYFYLGNLHSSCNVILISLLRSVREHVVIPTIKDFNSFNNVAPDVTLRFTTRKQVPEILEI